MSTLMKHSARVSLLLPLLAGVLALTLWAPAGRALAAVLQQATETPTLTPTHTATASPTGTLTVSPTGSITPGTGTPTLTPTTGTPGDASATPSPTLTPPAATATSAFQPPATPSPTPTLTLPPTEPPILVTPGETPTLTPTLIPLPAITFQYPQRTPTGVLLARQDPAAPTAMAKDPHSGGALRSFGRWLGRYTPLLLLAALWLALGVWFLASQWWVHRK